MPRLPTAAAAAALGAALALSSCSGGTGGDAVPTPSPSVASPSVASPSVASAPAAPGASESPVASPSPSPVATLAAAQCLRGRYALVRFVAVGGETYGTGQGGDVTVTFDDGRYTLAGAGTKGMVLTIGGETGNLTVDGEAKGTYRLKGATATFTAGSTTGTGRLDDGSGGSAKKITMKQVDSVIGLSGAGQVACTTQAMTITQSRIRLELARS